ncbi:hypothetical protein PZH37_17415, partial [[Eubacterium] siraeum]|nr:hypothetical protein [[Eubacterium] siraeum]
NFLSCFAFKSSARRIIFICKLTMGARFDGSASCRAFGRAASASVPRRDGGYRPSSLSGATPQRPHKGFEQQNDRRAYLRLLSTDLKYNI